MNTLSSKQKTIIGIILGVIAIFILHKQVFISDSDSKSDLKSDSSVSSTSVQTTEPVPVTEPRSGEILSGIEAVDQAKITITASRSESCIVKLKTRSGVERLSFYVRAGDTVTVGVPGEPLQVYFASGKTWYGKALLFGENTSYSKSDKVVDFAEYTYTVTLYPVSNGNFTPTPINKDEFLY